MNFFVYFYVNWLKSTYNRRVPENGLQAAYIVYQTMRNGWAERALISLFFLQIQKTYIQNSNAHEVLLYWNTDLLCKSKVVFDIHEIRWLCSVIEDKMQFKGQLKDLNQIATQVTGDIKWRNVDRMLNWLDSEPGCAVVISRTTITTFFIIHYRSPSPLYSSVTIDWIE